MSYSNNDILNFFRNQIGINFIRCETQNDINSGYFGSRFELKNDGNIFLLCDISHDISFYNIDYQLFHPKFQESGYFKIVRNKYDGIFGYIRDHSRNRINH